MTTVIGGPVDSRPRPEREKVQPPEGITAIELRYPKVNIDGATSYVASVAPLRLRAIVRPTDDGFVAEVPELQVLGYGKHLSEAVDDLTDAVRDYLTVVRESGGRLAPSVLHHAEYVALLDTPETSWFAAVDMPLPQDAADVG